MDALSRHEDYGHLALTESDLDADPIAQLAQWLTDADEFGVYEPNAMVLGTVDSDGTPSARTVLLRGIDERGLMFFTNYESRKGQAIASHPRVSAVFGWYAQHRQVIVDGVAGRITAEESDTYFASRPHGSQVSAWASAQSRPIEGRGQLEQQFSDAENRFDGDDVPRPEFWGGYRIVPLRIEFWSGRSSRRHDRIVFERRDPDAVWVVSRVQP
ncbi:MAG: pyridoxamine 5'-phosphate oxidase [Microbacteriaceae bacterium]